MKDSIKTIKKEKGDGEKETLDRISRLVYSIHRREITTFDKQRAYFSTFSKLIFLIHVS